MRMISEAEAFRGRWSVHPLGWLLLLLPVSALVALQEISTGFPTFALVIVSALAQHAAAGVLIVGVGGLVLRRVRKLSLAVVFSLWVGSGVLRGLVGGALAAAIEAHPPEYGYRIAYWCTVAVIWMPLFTYLLAQLESRGILLAELDRIEAELDSAREHARRTIDERTSELAAAVRHAVTPLLAEVRHSLMAAAAQDNEIALDRISRRLETVADEVRAVIHRPVQIRPTEDPSARPQWSLVIEALTFSRSRPFFVAGLITVAAAALFVPDSLRATGSSGVTANAVGITVGALAFVVSLLIARRLPHFSARHAIFLIVPSATATSIAVIATSQATEPRGLALLVAIPLAFGLAAAMLGGAVGVARGNLKAIATLEAYTEQKREVVEQSRVVDDVIADQVAEVLHGPILGRLSACIMALNFYLAESETSRSLRRNATTDGVVAHLDLIAIDLERLGGLR